jgi:hypothetical protein
MVWHVLRAHERFMLREIENATHYGAAFFL